MCHSIGENRKTEFFGYSDRRHSWLGWTNVKDWTPQRRAQGHGCFNPTITRKCKQPSPATLRLADLNSRCSVSQRMICIGGRRIFFVPLAIGRAEDRNVADWIREEAFRPQCTFTSIAGTVQSAPQVLVGPLLEKRALSRNS